MAKAIKPIGNHVLVQRATPAEISKGGIVLPESAKDNTRGQNHPPSVMARSWKMANAQASKSALAIV